jgi:hypothetical protein
MIQVNCFSGWLGLQCQAGSSPCPSDKGNKRGLPGICPNTICSLLEKFEICRCHGIWLVELYTEGWNEEKGKDDIPCAKAFAKNISQFYHMWAFKRCDTTMQTLQSWRESDYLKWIADPRYGIAAATWQACFISQEDAVGNLRQRERLKWCHGGILSSGANSDLVFVDGFKWQFVGL